MISLGCEKLRPETLFEEHPQSGGNSLLMLQDPEIIGFSCMIVEGM